MGLDNIGGLGVVCRKVMKWFSCSYVTRGIGGSHSIGWDGFSNGYSMSSDVGRA